MSRNHEDIRNDPEFLAYVRNYRPRGVLQQQQNTQIVNRGPVHSRIGVPPMPRGHFSNLPRGPRVPMPITPPLRPMRSPFSPQVPRLSPQPINAQRPARPVQPLFPQRESNSRSRSPARSSSSSQQSEGPSVAPAPVCTDAVAQYVKTMPQIDAVIRGVNESVLVVVKGMGFHSVADTTVLGNNVLIQLKRTDDKAPAWLRNPGEDFSAGVYNPVVAYHALSSTVLRCSDIIDDLQTAQPFTDAAGKEHPRVFRPPFHIDPMAMADLRNYLIETTIVTGHFKLSENKKVSLDQYLEKRNRRVQEALPPPIHTANQIDQMSEELRESRKKIKDLEELVQALVTTPSANLIDLTGDAVELSPVDSINVEGQEISLKTEESLTHYTQEVTFKEPSTPPRDQGAALKRNKSPSVSSLSPKRAALQRDSRPSSSQATRASSSHSTPARRVSPTRKTTPKKAASNVDLDKTP